MYYSYLYDQIVRAQKLAFLSHITYLLRQKRSMGTKIVYFSSHHSFSLRTCSSSLGVKSFLMLKVFLISSGVFPLIMLATVLHVTSSRPLMSRKFAARINSKRVPWSTLRKSASQEQISSVLFSLFSSSSGNGGSSL